MDSVSGGRGQGTDSTCTTGSGTLGSRDTVDRAIESARRNASRRVSGGQRDDSGEPARLMMVVVPRSGE
ncbi:hypothetical protein [Micromonospora zamorensis]|uniref:hypothetical protein n=1 Tax=Micromonospora zamorensis TaxID=709883 RepID=UPI0033AEB644